MSEDDKKNEDVKPEDAVVETIEAEPVEEVEAEDVLFEALDRELDEIAPSIVKENSGFGGLIVAGLLGGVATVVLVFGLGYFALKSDSLGGLSKLINGGDAAAAAEARYTDVSTRILSIEGELIEIQETMPEPTEPTDLSPIIDKIVALESLAAQQTEQSLDFSAAIEGIRERLSNVVLPSVSVNSAGVANEAARAVDLEKIADIEVEIAALTAELAAVKRVAENALEVAAAKNTGVAGDASGMATALAVASLERALQDEAPFEVELNALKGVAGDNVALAELIAYAATGLASEVTLLGQFNGLLDAALVADLKGDGKSIFDKFIGNAKAVISIRKTGNVEGSSAEAVLARMEVAVLNKNLSAAIAEGEGLEGPAKMVFAKWMAAVKSRMVAQDLMRQVSADILTSLQ
ncbi:MAG: hypothetical protein COB24_09785 [Hyphomicrobiales bacterium]|nr:MAG: hypothetical protein COB24_09785 [Hyphomicrobiales bacterium]